MHRFAAALGIVGGAVWVGLKFVPPECVPPTEASEVFCSRLWTVPLAAMFAAAVLAVRARPMPLGGAGRAGLVAVAVGFGLMTAGNGGEYWLASALPHQGPDALVRGLLRIAVLAGWLAALVGSTVVGASLVRSRSTPGAVGWSLVAAIPLTVVFGMMGLATLTVGLIGVAIGVMHLSRLGGRPG